MSDYGFSPLWSATNNVDEWDWALEETFEDATQLIVAASRDAEIYGWTTWIGGATGAGIIWGGAASYYSFNTLHLTMTGGFVWGGTAGLNFSAKQTWSMSGGYIWGGGAGIKAVIKYTMAGGYQWAGSATVVAKSPRWIGGVGAAGIIWAGAATVVFKPKGAAGPAENPNNDPYTAWLVAYANGAVSRYDAMPATSCCFFNGQLYVTNAVGVYAVNGLTDNGVNIQASFDTGLQDNDSPYKKTVQYVYVSTISGDAGAGLNLAVRTTADLTTESSYPVTTENTGVHGTRAILGRGVRARYWEYRVSNVAGSSFVIDGVDEEITKMTRKEI